MALSNGPPTERRDVCVVGANCARSPALAREVARVLAKMTLVQFPERLHSVLVIREEADEPIELSTCVAAVVPALTASAFPLVRQEVLDNCFDSHHATCLRRAARRSAPRFQSEQPRFWIVASGVLWQRAGVGVKVLVLIGLSTSKLENHSNA